MLAGEGWWWYYADDPRPDTDLLLPRTPRCHPSLRTQLYIFIFIFSASPPVCSSYWQVRLGQRVHVSGWHGPQQRPVETSGDHGASVPTLQLQVARLTTAWHNSLLPGSGLEPRKLWFISANVWLQLGLCCSKLGPRWRNFNSWLPRTVQCIQATSYKLILAVCDPFIWALSGLLPPWTLRM